MSFLSQMALDAERVHFNPLEAGETITYIAKRADHVEATAAAGSGDKTVRARVIRNKANPGVNDNGPNGIGGRPIPVNGVHFYVSKDATDGIVNVQKRLDRVKIPIDKGGAPVDMLVKRILSEELGTWGLEAMK